MKAEGQWKAGNESERGDEGKDCGAVGCHFLPEQHWCGLAFGKEGCPIPNQLPPSPPGGRILSRALWSREGSQSQILVRGAYQSGCRSAGVHYFTCFNGTKVIL